MKDEIAHGKVSSTWVVLVKSQHKWLQLGEVEGWGGAIRGGLSIPSCGQASCKVSPFLSGAWK